MVGDEVYSLAYFQYCRRADMPRFLMTHTVCVKRIAADLLGISVEGTYGLTRVSDTLFCVPHSVLLFHS